MQENTLEKLNRLKKEYLDVVKAEGMTYYKNLATKLFADAPDIVRVEWRQYIPYFNDGEVCEFDVCEVLFYDADDNEFYAPYAKNAETDQQRAAATFEQAMLPDDVLEALFGQHSKIIITRDDITVEDYDDHD